MIDGKFDVIFRGQVVKNIPLETIKANLVSLFRSSPESVERLFSGHEVTIKKDLDYPGAMKYQAALRKAGALALIKELSSQSEHPAQNAANPNQGEDNPNSIEAPQTAQEAQASNDVSSHPKSANDSIQPESINHQPVSDSKADAQASGLTVAEVGAALLPPKIYEQREVNTEWLSLAPVGERIQPAKPAEDIPPPNIEHLKLDNNY